MRNRWLNLIGLLGLTMIIGAQPAHAVCTNPDGVAGSIVFNKDHQVMQYCDDTNWRQVGSLPDALQGCPNGLSSCGGKTTERLVFAGNGGRGDATVSTVDTSCNNAAAAGGLHGVYFGWYATSPENDPESRYERSNVPYIMTNGAKVADNWNDLTDGTLDTNIDRKADGTDDNFLNATWTNVLADGTHSGDCTVGTAERGRLSAMDAGWTENYDLGVSCAIGGTYYCFEQGNIRATSIVSDGLIGHWRLDEVDFPYVDSSPTGANAINSGGTNPVSGPARLSEGLDFLDDSGRRISTATSATYAGLTTFTISAWIKSDDVEGGGYAGIIDIEGIGNIYSGWNDNRLSFRADGWDTQNGIWGVNDRLASNQWHHVAVTYDTLAPSGTKPTIYIDGVGYDDPSAAFIGSDNFVSPVSSIVTIGAVEISGWRGFNGEIDDVRIYNRILSAEEINYLANSFDTNITYDTDRRVPKYFNGDDWVAMGESKYVPNAVEFDGVDDFLRHTFSGTSGSKTGALNLWFKRQRTGVAESFVGSFQNRVTLGINPSDGISIVLKDTDGNFVYRTGGAGPIDDTEWHHLLMSWDLTDPSKNHFYIDDVDSMPAVFDYVDNGINYDADYTFGTDNVENQFFQGSVADFWFDQTSYVDFSIESNRRKFIDENGDPVYLGADGSLPTGSAPDMFLSGDTATWHLNKGTGAGFTENGELTDAITKPGGPFLPVDGLVGYWKLDEVSGSSVIDYASANNGTYLDSGGSVANVGAQGGVYGGAFDFTNHKVALGTPDDLDFSGTNAFTISAWVKPGDNYGEFVFHRGSGIITNGSYSFRRYSVDQTRWQAAVQDGSIFLPAYSAPGTVRVGEWALMTVTWDGTNLTIYENGVQLGTNSDVGFTGLADNPTPAYQETSIGGEGRGNVNYFNGSIDDVAVYNRALTVPEITAMYQSGICANPERLNGTIVYNADQNVMQYCDAILPGNGWQAIGQ